MGCLQLFSDNIQLMAAVRESKVAGVFEAVAVNSRLKEITAAYLTIEGLLQNPFLSEPVKEQLRKTLEMLNAESARELQRHAEQDRLHKLSQAS